MDTLNDAMYSDSRLVVDALAELMECVMERHQVVTVSEQRMTQVRYIMQVDEDSFRTHITADQLVTIESKEMAVILDELVSAIGLQRFRFADRQANGKLYFMIPHNHCETHPVDLYGLDRVCCLALPCFSCP